MRRLLAPLLTAAVVVAACGDDGSGDAAGGGDLVLRFQFTGEPEDAAVYDLLIEAFEEEHPEIEVRPDAIGKKSDHLAKLVTSFAGGSPPDVFLVNFREYVQFVTRGAIEPIEQPLATQGVDLDDYFDQPIEAFTFDGAVQCLPQNVSSLVVYWNRVLFERAGLPPPAEGWSWEEFRQVAIALTGGGLHGLGIEPSVIRLAPFVWSAGGEIVDDPDEPTRLTFDSPAAREALEFVVGLVRDDRVVPTETDVAAQDLETRFTAGRLGMFLSSRREVPAFREVVGLDWDVASLPVRDEPSTILHSDGFCLSEGGDHVDAAAQFVAFAAGPTGQGILALGGRIVPALRSVASSPSFLDPTTLPEHDEVFVGNIEVMRRTPVLSTWPEIEDRAEEIFTRAFYEPGYTIDDAIAALEAETPPLLEEGARDQ